MPAPTTTPTRTLADYTPGESTRRVWASHLDELNTLATTRDWWMNTPDGRFLCPQAPAWFHDQYATAASVGYANGWL